MRNFFSRLNQHIGKHPCCYVLLMFPLSLFLYLHDIFLAKIITPFRCEMWEGKEVEVFLTPEEWRKLSGVNESLKDTEWVYYPTIEGQPEKDPFFIKNQGLYQPVMYFNGNKHYLISVNNKYPYLNSYSYINPTTIFGHNTYVLYDNKLKKEVFQYHSIAGYYTNPLSGLADNFACNENYFSDFDKLLQNYLH
ncbi:hypothetical protein A6A10_07905 [Otariodibacter oris]|uniref:Uncharacterized protein n=2 Tax=Otariodibacter oris TaxID=1032623 RepID=A0A420XH81_9PAST|nr:hypothetical protein A6A10_07905 [Otariodibacter oris]RKR72908.1 hypothetical protein DES31_1075 [Otariodibacter oris]